jgi:hypothetical protein
MRLGYLPNFFRTWARLIYTLLIPSIYSPFSSFALTYSLVRIQQRPCYPVDRIETLRVVAPASETLPQCRSLQVTLQPHWSHGQAHQDLVILDWEHPTLLLANSVKMRIDKVS